MADRGVEGEGAGGVLAGWSQIRVAQSGDGQVARGRLGNQPADAAFEVQLHLLGGPEERHVLTEVPVVEHLVGADELGEPAQGEVHLEVQRPVVDGIDAPGECFGQRVAVEELGEGGGRVEVGHHDRCRGHLAATQGHTLDPSVGDDDL